MGTSDLPLGDNLYLLGIENRKCPPFQFHEQRLRATGFRRTLR